MQMPAGRIVEFSFTLPTLYVFLFLPVFFSSLYSPLAFLSVHFCVLSGVQRVTKDETIQSF